MAAFDGQIGQAAYSASKGGIVGMTLPVARDLAELGIRVMTIAPGIFETPLLGTLPRRSARLAGRAGAVPRASASPRSTPRSPCTSSRTGMLNGETIRLDGAIRMQPR